MKIMIEVIGGNVCNIVATEEVSIFLIDHDNLINVAVTKLRSEKGNATINKDLAEARKAQQPDLICDEEEFDENLGDTLLKYEDIK